MESSRQEAQASSSNRSCDHVHGGGDRSSFDRPAELMSVDQCDSKLVEAPIVVAGGFGGGAASPAVEVKRKRGRPPRGTTPASRKTTPVTAVEEEEDVCFICFDGGSLVLCDRRNCPKAYHPACIKRDESFFRSRAKWNCGWHICSTCMKASHYLCYTCTFSSCKGCINNADYVCVRGNKGFCGTCKRTILLIENYEGNKEGPQVDFDDKTSWEYLFKVYWVLLKGNLSLTLDELLKAKNPWSPPQVSASNWGFSGGLNGGIRNGSTISANSVPDLEVLNAKRRKINTKTNVLVTGNSLGIEKHGGDTVTHLNGDTNWASKELLEFVAHMRNGDTSVMSQFDVQNLVLDYIRTNNLRDPLQKCEIVCDSRLSNMFGQARLDHIEMLKLLESHFLIKDDHMVSSMEGIGVAEAVGSQMGSSGDYNSQMITVNDSKRKLRRRAEKGSPTNPDAYAKIDVNNIKLIYLRRCLLENLVDNAENFHEKVVGSIVRIRVSCSDQKPDMHRLVRVVGTSKGAEPYKLGTRDTNLMLDILNLDKKEVMAIHRISNQEFSQEECERLRQSIKFGLIKRLTVGEIQEKAIALQEVKLNDWIEAEKLRLNDLRNRASEKGHRKEMRECSEKLERLNSPDERKRMLEVPVVHSDPSMDPSYDFDHKPSELHQNKQVSEYKAKPRKSGVGRRKKESTPTEKRRESKTSGMNDLNTPKQEADSTDSGTDQSVDDWEMYKIWHYQDPTGKIQGPFLMAQLRKWSISGHFPPHLRVWRLNEKPDDSILLTDILDGLCSKDQLSEINVNMPRQEREANAVSDEEKNNNKGEADHSRENERVDINQGNGESVGRSVNLDLNDQIKNLDDSNEAINTDGLGSNPSSSPAAVFANPSDGNSTNLPVDLDSLFDEVLPTQQPQVSTSRSTLALLGKQTPLREVNEDREPERNSDRSENAWQNTDSETRNNQGSENRSDGEAQSGHSSGQSWRPPVSDSSPVNKESECLPKSLETSDQTLTGVDLSTSPPIMVKPSNRNEGQAEEVNTKQSASSSIVPVQDNGLSWSTTSSLVAGYCPGPSTKPSVEEWDPSLVAAEIAGDHAKTPASISDHLTPSSPSHPHSNSSSWIPDPDEFSSLLNESVSDLLAEVEAMESLHALSCHNVVNSAGPAELPKSDCISPVEGFSPAPEPGKGDALSSTAEAHLPVSQSNFVDELFGVGSDRSPEACPPSISPETEGDAKHSEVSVDQWDGSSGISPAAASWNVEISETPWNADWGAVGNGVMDWNPPPPPPPPPPPAAPVIVVAPPPPPPPPAPPVPTPPQAPPTGGILGSQPRHGSGRYSPRDRAYHGKDSGFGRNRNAWNNRQPYFAGGGAPMRAPAKGQRVCKFYESGYCKRGSSCSFFHP